MLSLAAILQQQDRSSDVDELLKETLQHRRRILGADGACFSPYIHTLGQGRFNQYHVPEAGPSTRQGLKPYEHVFGKLHRDAVTCTTYLAKVLKGQSRYDEAEEVCRSALDLYRALFGRGHSRTILTWAGLAGILVKTKRISEAETMWREMIGIQEEQMRANPALIDFTCHGLAVSLLEQNKYSAVEVLFDRALNVERTTPDYRELKEVGVLHLLYQTTSAHGKHYEAGLLCQERVDLFTSLGGLQLSNAHHDPACCLLEQDRLDEARALFQRVLEGNRTRLGEEHPETFNSARLPCLVLDKQDRFAEAEPLLRHNVVFSKKRNNEDLIDAIAVLGYNLYRQKLYIEAETLFQIAFMNNKARLGEEHPHTHRIAELLCGALEGQEKFTKAEPLRRQHVAFAEKKENAAELKNAIFRLGCNLYNQDLYVEAEDLFQKKLQWRTTTPEEMFSENHMIIRIEWLWSALEAQSKFEEADAIREKFGIVVEFYESSAVAESDVGQGEEQQAEEEEQQAEEQQAEEQQAEEQQAEEQQAEEQQAEEQQAEEQQAEEQQAEEEDDPVVHHQNHQGLNLQQDLIASNLAALHLTSSVDQRRNSW